MTWQTHSTQDELLKRVCAAYSFVVISIDSYLFLLPHSNQSAFAAVMAKSKEDRPNFKLMHMPFAAKEMLVRADVAGIDKLFFSKKEAELVHQLLLANRLLYSNASGNVWQTVKDNPLHNMTYEEACVFIDINT